VRTKSQRGSGKTNFFFLVWVFSIAFGFTNPFVEAAWLSSLCNTPFI
jgi:hypothetical protein